LAAPPTGKPLGLTAPMVVLACTGSGRRSGVGSGAGGAPFFVFSSRSGARRAASLRDGMGVRTQNRANWLDVEAELQQWTKVRVEEEHHRLSYCAVPEFTMASRVTAKRPRHSERPRLRWLGRMREWSGMNGLGFE